MMTMGLVVVGDSYFFREVTFPLEDDAPLVVDSDAVEPGEVASKRLEAVSRDVSQVGQQCRGGENIEFSLSPASRELEM
jgi:hypothetical protein